MEGWGAGLGGGGQQSAWTYPENLERCLIIIFTNVLPSVHRRVLFYEKHPDIDRSPH